MGVTSEGGVGRRKATVEALNIYTVILVKIVPDYYLSSASLSDVLYLKKVWSDGQNAAIFDRINLSR